MKSRCTISVKFSGSLNSGTSGISHIGSAPSGWYQAMIRPLRSMVG